MGHEVIFFRYFNYFKPRNEQKPYFFLRAFYLYGLLAKTTP